MTDPFYYNNTSTTFIELPGTNHGGSSGISFADGNIWNCTRCRWA